MIIKVRRPTNSLRMLDVFHHQGRRLRVLFDTTDNGDGTSTYSCEVLIARPPGHYFEPGS